MKTVSIKNTGELFEVGKIVCIGRNYAAHAEELNNPLPNFPLIFLKPPSAMISSGEKIVHPDYSNEMHYEAELVLLIGEKLKVADDVIAERAITGYGTGLDMTLRDIQSQLKEKGHPWTVAKCFDTSAVVSEFMLKEDYPLTLDEEITLKLNGEVKQQSKLNMMHFKPVEIVKYLSSRMTLEKGDLIFTGTPAGVGKADKGDKLAAGITNLPDLVTEVV